MNQHIVVQYSDDGMWGSEPVPEDTDVRSSYAKFENMLKAEIYKTFPEADVDLEYGINDRHTIDGATDHEDAALLGEIIHRVWVDFTWVVGN